MPLLHDLSVFAAALLTALAVTRLAIPLGVRLGIVARPGGRRRHRGARSRLGGVGIAAGFFAGLLVDRLAPLPTADPLEGRRLLGLALGALWMFLLGLADDRFDLPPWQQYLGYLVAGLIAAASAIILERFNNPFGEGMIVLPLWLYLPLTLFWFTGMTVTVNWLDGLDGLAAGVSAILALVLAVHMAQVGQVSVVPQALALAGAAMGFLAYNKPPARLFMGSSGAFTLGYLLAALGLIAGARVATVLMVMGLPILDVALTIGERWAAGAPLTQGDRRHLHFRLQDAGLATWQIVLAYWTLCALFGTLALSLPTRLYKLLALGVAAIIAVSLLLYANRRAARK